MSSGKDKQIAQMEARVQAAKQEATRLRDLILDDKDTLSDTTSNKTHII